MAIIVGIMVVIMIFILVGKRKEHSKQWRPYIGLLLIAGLIAILGGIVGIVQPDLSDFFYVGAKWMATGTGILACVHLIFLSVRAFFL